MLECPVGPKPLDNNVQRSWTKRKQYNKFLYSVTKIYTVYVAGSRKYILIKTPAEK
jgi:hypothetical protein